MGIYIPMIYNRHRGRRCIRRNFCCIYSVFFVIFMYSYYQWMRNVIHEILTIEYINNEGV